MKRFIKSATIFVMMVTAGLAIAHGQTTKTPSAETPTDTKGVSLSDKHEAAILKLQRDRSNAIIAQQQLQAQWDKVSKDREAVEKKINDFVVELAVEQKIDLKLYYFDFDNLQFKQRPAAEKQPEK